VTPGGPAARAGVQQGDVVVSVGGRPVTPDESLAYLISQQPVGARIPLELIRDGRRQTVTVTTTQRPTVEELARISGVQPEQELTEAPREQQSTSQRSARASLGVTVQTLTPEIARSLNLRDATVRGVVVTSVDQSSDAGQKLQTGDIIQSINQRATRTPEEAAAALEAARTSGRNTALLLVRRGNQSRYIGVELARR
jgi:serine protease Do